MEELMEELMEEWMEELMEELMTTQSLVHLTQIAPMVRYVT